MEVLSDIKLAADTDRKEDFRTIQGDPEKTLRLFRARLARAKEGNGQCVVACLGNSLTEGYYVDDLKNRWTEMLGDDLAAFIGKSKSWYLPTASGLGVGPEAWPDGGNPWTITGTVDFAPGVVGANLLAVTMHPNAAMETTFNGRLVQLVYTRGPASTGNAFRITIDGQVVIGDLHTRAASTLPSQIWTSPVLAEGEHTIKLEYLGAAGTGAVIEGLFIYEGLVADGMVSVLNFGHGSYRAADFAAQDLIWETLFHGINPALVVVELGVNDNSLGRTPAQFEADYREVIQRLRTGVPAETGFVCIAWRPNDGWDQTKKDLWLNSFVPAIKRVAREELADRSIVVEVEEAISDDIAMFPDGVHPGANSGAHSWINSLMLEILGVPEPPRGLASSGVGTSIPVQPEPPESPQNNDLWYDTDETSVELGIRAVPITLAAYNALPTPRDQNILYLIVG